MKIFTIVGARPQFIKAAAVSRAIAKDASIEESIVHTGQHYDSNMSDIFFEELGIPQPSRNLGVSGGGHGEMTGQMLAGLEQAMIEDKPDAALIYGDTNSTLAGALAAAKLHIPVVHVEAGLRSFNKRMPEEINRIVADNVSDLLLCPTQVACDHLKSEGITKGVELVGDVMHDATLFAIEQSKTVSTILDDLELDAGTYAVCTIHRAENTDDPDRFARVLDFVEAEAEKQTVILPVHPRTRKMMEKVGRSTLKGVRLIDPLGYFDLHRLLGDATLVLTDSGGLQKEAYFHRLPCITMRDETEWVETIEAGWNRLWLDEAWKSPRRDIPDYGSGDAAERTVAAIKAHFA